MIEFLRKFYTCPRSDNKWARERDHDMHCRICIYYERNKRTFTPYVYRDENQEKVKDYRRKYWRRTKK